MTVSRKAAHSVGTVGDDAGRSRPVRIHVLGPVEVDRHPTAHMPLAALELRLTSPRFGEQPGL